jgi:hypothetical protein
MIDCNWRNIAVALIEPRESAADSAADQKRASRRFGWIGSGRSASGT